MTRLALVTMSMVCSLVPAGAGATVLAPVDLPELVRDAGAIVRGRVAAVEGRWTPDRRTIETIVTLDVAASLKGALGDTVQFVVPGGTLGRYRRIVVGAPEMIVGQQLIVFLAWRGPTYPYVLGLSQGVYRVVADGSQWRVTPPPLAGTAGMPPVRIVRGDPFRRAMTLEEFEGRVRALAGQFR
jgi:hypothetical protein